MKPAKFSIERVGKENEGAGKWWAVVFDNKSSAKFPPVLWVAQSSCLEILADRIAAAHKNVVLVNHEMVPVNVDKSASLSEQINTFTQTI